MAVAVVVPSAGDAVTEGRIARWLVADGAAVKADQNVFELETDKLTVEVPSPSAGVLKILVQAGEVVKVGQTVADVDPARVPAAKAEPAAASGGRQPPEARGADAPRSPEVRASPAAAAAIRDKALDPAKLPATGPGGRITKDDVLAHLAGAPAETKPAEKNGPRPADKSLATVTAQVVPIQMPREAGVRETRQPMSMIRKRIAERLLES
ncbi:MAG: biotin/lipoyl-containing protein, partial [Gemmataceae bacterium]